MKLTRRNLPLNAMRAFEAAARHCHLRKAAEELGVTHGAVSRQVKQLEQQLRVELFDRGHNRLALTSAGQRLLLGVQEGLDKIAASALYLDPESMAGRLTIASTPSISAGWLVRLMGGFSRQFPEIELHLLNIAPQQRELPSEVDVAICYGRPEAKQREIVELFRERYLPVCSPQLLDAAKPLDNPEQLMGYPLLHDRHGHWLRWFAAVGLGQERALQNMYLQDAFQVISAVREGYGIGLIDAIEIETDLQKGTLVTLFEQSVLAEQAHFLVTEQVQKMTVRSRLFVEYLQSALPEK
ncbi:LysR substrate-binding domain-containing protein [Oceanicoccus sp. KOV_DT_Chl]|uniref:LysR substrate-binding domain-containing protein n=1 Tax=Oceanicoccus sp. KOV_DT_Chl TaxID=1904639 RepID=UPI000C7C378F|nr:LysR substrate-binding domain-containing protein [Oceanicoccus sp. KOV_DT_Chl]